MKKITRFVIFCLIMITLYTAIVTILKAVTGADFSQEYTTFCGVFGGELLCTCILKALRIKKDD